MASDNKGEDLSTPELVKAKLNKDNFVVDLDAFDDFLADMESDHDSFAGENKYGSIDDEDSSLFSDDSDFESLDSPSKDQQKAFSTRSHGHHAGDLEQLFSKGSSKTPSFVPAKQSRSSSETLSRSSDHGSRRDHVRARKRDGLSQSEHRSRGDTSSNLWDDAMKSAHKSKTSAAKSPSSESKSLSLSDHRITATGNILSGSDHGHRRPDESSPSISSTRKVAGMGVSLPSRRGADPLSQSEHKPRRRGRGDELSRSDHSNAGSRGLSLTRESDHVITATGNILSVSSHGSRQQESSSSRPARYASTQALAARRNADPVSQSDHRIRRRGRGDELSQSDHSATASRGLSLTAGNMPSGSGHGHRRRERAAGTSASRSAKDPLSRSDHGLPRRGRRDELCPDSGHQSSGHANDTPSSGRTPRRGKKDSLSQSEHASRRRSGDSKSPVPTSNRSLSSERRPLRRRRDDLTQSEHGRVRSSRHHDRSDSDHQGEDAAIVSPAARRSRRPMSSRSTASSKSPVRTSVKPRSVNSDISTSAHRLVGLGQF
eukprot:Nitzschia sp. Nitz4//scaffold126_size65214//31858//33492//NITZ4_006157-RA/size65214-processed-gene-0.39-mRNA-1//-1//CDS//3329534692//209//frame0